MNKLVIGGIVFTLALLGIVFGIAGGKSDMSSDMVNLYSAIAAVAIIGISVAVVLKYVNQMQNDTASGELGAHEWDGIGEYKNELPKGWAIMFLLTIAWFFYYVLVKYPVASYSQIGEYNEEVAAYDKTFATKFKEIEKDPALMLKMGESVFKVNCAPCHGITGDGLGATDKRSSLKAENLETWGSANSVKETINDGRTGKIGSMPNRTAIMVAPNYTPITDAQIDAVSEYVANGLQGTKGADVFQNACASCHGKTGDGINYGTRMGADLRAYGSASFIDTIIKNGIKGDIGVMPAFGHSEAMTPLKIKAAAAYVKSLQGAN